MYLGVDAGNSKSVALISASDGEIVGVGRSGCGDIYGVPDENSVVAAVVECVGMSLESASVRTGELHAAAFRLAGADWPEDRAFWLRTLHEAFPDLTRLSVLNDGFAPIRCTEPSGVAVAVTVGTGSAIAGRGPRGDEWSLSWWGQDRLGAVGIGSEALAAAFRAELGLSEATSLAAGLLDVYGAGDVEDLLHSFTRRHGRRPWQDRGLAAPLVLAAAAAGEPTAVHIIDRHAQLIAEYAKVAAVRSGFEPDMSEVPVVLAGPVIAAQPVLRDAAVTYMREAMPRSRPTPTSLPPVAGAVLDAMAEGGAEITSAILDNLTGSSPDVVITQA